MQGPLFLNPRIIKVTDFGQDSVLRAGRSRTLTNQTNQMLGWQDGKNGDSERRTSVHNLKGNLGRKKKILEAKEMSLPFTYLSIPPL